MCDTCVKMFKKGVLGAEYKFTILECILCRAGFFTVLIKPLTCGVRIFGIDGGGTRGVVFFKVSYSLVEDFRFRMQIAEFF